VFLLGGTRLGQKVAEPQYCPRRSLYLFALSKSVPFLFSCFFYFSQLFLAEAGDNALCGDFSEKLEERIKSKRSLNSYRFSKSVRGVCLYIGLFKQLIAVSVFRCQAIEYACLNMVLLQTCPYGLGDFPALASAVPRLFASSIAFA